MTIAPKVTAQALRFFAQDIFSKDQNLIFYVQFVAEYFLTELTLEQWI
ncbi:hypothetical protein OAI29_06350 [Amylibacter sp.]|nr:hypothetical protein [Amylibacter sp.]